MDVTTYLINMKATYSPEDVKAFKSLLVLLASKQWYAEKHPSLETQVGIYDNKRAGKTQMIGDIFNNFKVI